MDNYKYYNHDPGSGQLYPGYQLQYMDGHNRGAPVGSSQILMDDVDFQTRKRWDWSFLNFSVFTLLCCCPGYLCNVIGVMCAALSYSDHKSTDYERSRNKRCTSICCSVTGFFIGLIFFGGITALCVLVATGTAPGFIMGFWKWVQDQQQRMQPEQGM